MGAATQRQVSGVELASFLEAIELELCRTCKVMEELVEHAVPSRDEKGRASLHLGPGWICWVGSEGPLSQITPCCSSLGVTLLFYWKPFQNKEGRNNLGKQIFSDNGEQQYKLLFSVNGRKLEKHIIALAQHRLYCCKRDLVGPRRGSGGEIAIRRG